MIVWILCSIIVLLLAVLVSVFWKMDRELDRQRLLSEKYSVMYFLMNEWLKATQKGKRVDKFLIENGYFTIAIYGIHYMGERLYDVLSETEIKVLYAIDKSMEQSWNHLKVYKLDEEWPKVDAIIVTSPYYYYEIKKKLERNVACPVFSINQIIERMS